MPESPLLSSIFASAVVGEIFSDYATLQAMLDFEAALAEAEAEVGVIPATSVAPIKSAADATLYDLDAIAREAALAGNVAIPLVKALTAKVNERARGHVHWGATSQDVIDTGFVLCAREALAHIRSDLNAAADVLAVLIKAHRRTVMAGRTLMQQALPITFAFKAAGWLSGLVGAAARIRSMEANALALQFGGAAGTLAALGADGSKVGAALAAKLQLKEASITWHAERGRILDIASALASLSGAASKIATDVLLLMQTEVAEAFEPAAPGKGGSSTMPHKRNPVGAVAIRANHRRIAGLMATITMSLEQEHERAAGAWAAEWETLRELFVLSAGSLERLRDMLVGLEVDPERMRANLHATLGLPLAESLMMALAKTIGRLEAHHRVEAASKLALASNRPLAEVAKAEPAIAGNISAEEIDRALDPRNYLGSADLMIDAVLETARKEFGGEMMAEITTSDGVKIHYEVEGREDGPPLVFSNSLGTNLHMWDVQAKEAAGLGFGVIRYDQRGHGKSDAPKGAYTLARLGLDLLELLDALGIERAELCALSMGGMTAMHLAKRHPRRFARIALCNTAAFVPPKDMWDARIKSVTENGMDAVVDGVLDRWFTPAFRTSNQQEVERIRVQILSTNPIGYAGCSAAIRDMDERDQLGLMEAPVLVVVGAHDPATTPEKGQYLVERIPGARKEVLDAAHLSNVERPDDFNRIVLGFFAGGKA